MRISNGRLALTTMALTMLMGTVLSGCDNQENGAQVTSPVSPQIAKRGPDCGGLSGLKLPKVEIISARIQPAELKVEGARLPDMTGTPQGAPVEGLPEFCRVTGSIHPTPESDIQFEVWMPVDGWNGRFFGANNGGLAGSIRYDDLAAAIRNGGAGAATDTGHSYMDPDWAKGQPERVRDYGWRAIHETTVVGKKLVENFYGRPPDNAYFIGCSNGGRMALIEAARFPDDYDGIVAGAPAVDFTTLVSTMINTYRVQQPPGAKLRREQAALLQSEVIRQCDSIDGQADGIVVNPLDCAFDYAALSCEVSDSSLCFSDAQIAALSSIHKGPRDSAGNRVGFGFPPAGAEVGLGNVGWDGALMSAGPGLAYPILQDMPAEPLASPEDFDFDTDPARLKAALARDLDTPPDLTRFFNRGGKLIIWHGWADPILPPEAALTYYQEALQNSGSRAAESMRLFMIPGMQHCSGGTGADAFGQVGAAPAGASAEGNVAAAITAWVEEVRTPEALIGQHGQNSQDPEKRTKGPVMERLHCAWPSTSVLKPGADPDKASSYQCDGGGR